MAKARPYPPRKPLPSQSRLQQLLRYEAETGALYWRANRRNNLAGREAGRVVRGRYRSITVDGVPYQAHRLVWVLHHGTEPGDVLDHINGNVLDNRVENLRPATTAQNGWNRGNPRTNSSGYKGVCWHSRDRRWAAYIKTDGVRQHLGNFYTPEAASAAYVRAASVKQGEFAWRAT